MADTYNISAIQGSTLLLNINCRDSNQNFINFSGYSARGYVKQKYSSSSILLDLNPQIHSSYISGLITISGSQTGIAAIPVGVYVYDIEAYLNDYTFKAVRGSFYVEPQATNL